MLVNKKAGQEQTEATAGTASSELQRPRAGSKSKSTQPALEEIAEGSGPRASGAPQIKFGFFEPDVIPKRDVEDLIGRYNKLRDAVKLTLPLQEANVDNFTSVIPEELQKITNMIGELAANVGQTAQVKKLQADSAHLTKSVAMYKTDFDRINASIAARRSKAAGVVAVIDRKKDENAALFHQNKEFQTSAAEDAAANEALKTEKALNEKTVREARSHMRALDEDFQAKKDPAKEAAEAKETAKARLATAKEDNAGAIDELKEVKAQLTQRNHQRLAQTLIDMSTRHEETMAEIHAQREPLGDVRGEERRLKKLNDAMNDEMVEGTRGQDEMQKGAAATLGRHNEVLIYRRIQNHIAQLDAQAPQLEAEIAELRAKLQGVPGRPMGNDAFMPEFKPLMTQAQQNKKRLEELRARQPAEDSEAE
jgi:hypothetical protein